MRWETRLRHLAHLPKVFGYLLDGAVPVDIPGTVLLLAEGVGFPYTHNWANLLNPTLRLHTDHLQ